MVNQTVHLIAAFVKSCLFLCLYQGGWADDLGRSAGFECTGGMTRSLGVNRLESVTQLGARTYVQLNTISLLRIENTGPRSAMLKLYFDVIAG